MAQDTGKSLDGWRILVAEDEHFIADPLIHELESAGATVIGPAPTLPRALALAEAQPLDAAVLDINLRREMVYPLADWLLAAGIPFVFATGYDATVIPAAYGHVPRCEKPVSTQAIIAALKGWRPGS
jgi:CheY-like chemotaxis protein